MLDHIFFKVFVTNITDYKKNLT